MGKNDNFLKYAGGDMTTPHLGLERVQKLLDLTGNPDAALKIIHVAGTNGKGSVCRFVLSILKESGKKVGLFSSPCLTDRCDAISVNGENITTEDLNKLYEEIRLSAERMTQAPTPFEINTIAALMYFKRKKCDYCILETGLGGAEDATNVISKSVADVFVPIAKDHTEYLGETLEEIANVKAGIIKSGSCVVTSQQQESVEKILKKHAQGNDFIVADCPVSTGICGINEIFDYKNIRDIHCGLGGLHQIHNAAVAIEVARALDADDENIKLGIKNAENPARFEMLQNDGVCIVFDGAHNPHGMRMFAENVNRYFKDCKKNIIFAAMHDKNIEKMALELKKISGDTTFFAVGVKKNERAEKSGVISSIFQKNGLNCTDEIDIRRALKKCDKSNPVFVCGSLYLYKEFREELDRLSHKIQKKENLPLT